jgi:hypothetical protein
VARITKDLWQKTLKELAEMPWYIRVLAIIMLFVPFPGAAAVVPLANRWLKSRS